MAQWTIISIVCSLLFSYSKFKYKFVQNVFIYDDYFRVQGDDQKEIDPPEIKLETIITEKSKEKGPKRKYKSKPMKEKSFR